MDPNEEISDLRNEIDLLRKDIARLSPSLETILKTRGYHIYRRNRHAEPLLPSSEYHDQYYSMLGSYSFRLFLRDVINHKKLFTLSDVARYSTRDVAAKYCSELIAMDIITSSGEHFSLRNEGIKSFGPTLEWYITELLRREYHTEVIRNVSFKRPCVGGDYDVIAKLAWRLLYMEVKSSPPKQVEQREISAFCRRVTDLAPEIAVFFMDTELRMKDKIVPMFEEELSTAQHPVRPARLYKELFHIDGRIFIMNSKGSIGGNLQRILRSYFLYNKE